MNVMRRLLLCTDLDRTLIPNGMLLESPSAKEYLEHLVQREDITLAYVTGRHRGLIEQAIEEFNLPTPNYAIADVGTIIYQVTADGWYPWQDWSEHLATDWASNSASNISQALVSIPELQPQEVEKQSLFKLSYYVASSTDTGPLDLRIEACLKQLGVNANLIWSIDEEQRVRLLDILPAGASKLRAVRYLMRQKVFHLHDTVFAGDSGNDLDVLASEIRSVLVANAESELKAWAIQLDSESLYVAQGGILGMNGNYRAGIIEGAMHYWPEVKTWFDALTLRKSI